MKQSGGYITVHSAPQQGSTFSVYLPVVCGSDLTSAPAESRKQSHMPGHETILLVDNEEDLRNASCEYLESCGYRVLTAGDGKEAVEICDRHTGSISLLISDLVDAEAERSRIGGACAQNTSGYKCADDFRLCR